MWTTILRKLRRWLFSVHRMIPEDNRILFFKRDRDDFGFLSNFAESPFELDGHVWPTVEHYYQAQKSNDEQYRETIRTAPTPGRAKRLGDHHTDKPRKYRKQSLFFAEKELLRDDWNDELKLSIMERALKAKFCQNVNLLNQLLATDEAELIEDSERDNFWGLGQEGCGNNHLGRLLMLARAELNNDNSVD